MKSYTVMIKEVHVESIFVYADSPADALERVDKGEGEFVGELEYDYTLESDEWTVEENEQE